eukprot:2972060-Lingulodinium_polyedra.AAC.1
MKEPEVKEGTLFTMLVDGGEGGTPAIVCPRGGRSKRERILHATVAPEGAAEETACGETLGREIKARERADFVRPKTSHLSYT